MALIACLSVKGGSPFANSATSPPATAPTASLTINAYLRFCEYLLFEIIERFIFSIHHSVDILEIANTSTQTSPLFVFRL